MYHAKTLIAAAAACTALAAPAVASDMPRGLRCAPLIRADGEDPAELFRQLRASVEELRNTQETRIGTSVDTLVTAKLTAVNETIDNLSDALQTIQARVEANVPAGVIGELPGNPEYVGNFRTHMRIGDRASADVQNAMQIGTAADGGYLAPIEWDRSITESLVESSPIRANSQVITIGGQGFSRLYTTGQPGSGWVGETAARPQTTTPQLATLEFRTGEIYANPAITQTALDDAAIDLEAWLRDSVRGEFARQEGIAFLSGDGVNKPFGLLGYVEGGVHAARHPLGFIDSISTAGNLAAGPAGDDFLNLIYELPTERSANARFYMNRMTEARIRKLKDSTGNYIWQPSMTAAAPNTIFGSGVVHIPGMPVPAAGAIIALYGDMRETYLVIDRIGIRVLRDPYTNKPFVMFYTTKRVGGGVQNPEFMRALKSAAA